MPASYVLVQNMTCFFWCFVLFVLTANGIKDQLSTKIQLLGEVKIEATGDLKTVGFCFVSPLDLCFQAMDLHGVPRREVEKDQIFEIDKLFVKQQTNGKTCERCLLT